MNAQSPLFYVESPRLKIPGLRVIRARQWVRRAFRKLSRRKSKGSQ